MKITQFFATLRPVRFLITLFAGIAVFFAQVSPAAAIGSTPSRLDSGSVHLDGVQKESEETLKGIPGMKEVERKSNEGLNEAQGAADVGKMNRPSNSQQAKSVKEEAEGVLKKVTGQK
jgi:hypothetical protein